MCKPFLGFHWLIFSLCLSLVAGFPGCSSRNTNSVSRMTFLVKETSFPRTNIGLIGASLGVPEKFTLPSDLFLEPDAGLVMQVLQGIWKGAVAGFEVGQVFCGSWGERGRIQINGDATLVLTLLVLCGGGLVGGASIGAAYGMVAPLFASPHQSKIYIAQERVIQGIWRQLTNQKMGQRASPPPVVRPSSFGDSGGLVGFGRTDQPYSAFMRIVPIRVGLFSKSKFNSTVFTLVWKVRVIFFDTRERMVAKQIIEIEQGEYGFDEWAEKDAMFLKEKLEQGYQLAADQIMGKLSAQ